MLIFAQGEKSAITRASIFVSPSIYYYGSGSVLVFRHDSITIKND